MASKPATKNALFQLALAKLRKKWPEVMISVRDRARFNETMRLVNKNSKKRKKRKKRKKAVAT